MTTPEVPGGAPEAGLAHRAFGAVLWTASQRWAVRITGFVTVAILTRLLSPAEFGTVAIALSLLPIAYLLADMGFSTYIVQAKDVDQRMLSTAFWFTSAIGVVLAGALVAAAPLISALFDVPDVALVVVGLAPAVLIVTLTTVPMSLLRRRMRFQALATQSIVAALVGQAAAVVIALMGFGVWALVAQTVLNQLVVSVFGWMYARWRPGLSFSVHEFRAMASLGVKVVGVEIVEVGRSLVENAIVIAALGVTGLGYLNVAQRLTQIAQDVTAAAILPVSTVVFARVRDAPVRLRSVYRRSLSLAYGVIVPVMVFVALTSPILLPGVFGQKWGPSVVTSQVLAVASIFVMGAMLDHGLLYGAGRPGVWFIYAVVIDGLTVLSAALMARHGLVFWALGFLAVAIVATFVRWPLVASVLESSWRSLAWLFLRAMATAVVSGGIGFAVYALCGSLNPVICVLVTGVAVVLAQLLAMRMFMREALKDIFQMTVVRLGGLVRSRRATREPESSPVPGENDHVSRNEV